MPSRGLYAGLVACFVLLNHFASAIPGLYKDQRPLITASSSLYEKPAAPYVGFDLSLSYGVAAIRHANGTYTDVAYVDATPEYQAMIRLSLQSSKHNHPPYNPKAGNDEWSDTPRQWVRKWRKRLGLPASYEVGLLSNMLTGLRDEVERRLGHQIDTAVVTWPRLVALYVEDIKDVFEHVGLNSTTVFEHEWGAAMAAHEVLTQRLRPGDLREVLVTMLTQSAFYVSKDLCDSPSWKRMYGSDDESEWNWTLDFNLGLDALHDNPDEAYYWEELRRRLIEGLLNSRTDYVILIGESAGDKQFVALVKDVVDGTQSWKPVYHLSNPLLTPARGAARFHELYGGEHWAEPGA